MNSALKTWQEEADVSKHDYVHLQFLWCTSLYAQEIEQKNRCDGADSSLQSNSYSK